MRIRLIAPTADYRPETLAAIQVEVIVIGGTGWSHVARRLEQALQERGLELPILNPLPAVLDEAIRQLKALDS